jgi:hypothetical protein
MRVKEFAMDEQFDVVDFILRFEDGDLSDEETIRLFQYLTDIGTVWKLPGRYGRLASMLLSGGKLRQRQPDTAAA